MRHLALAIAAVFMLALVGPAFAQPFADVPADHWAFDAIAELAAKGILEGYPDGTFKGDRAMTRYEMAMALARILARIEAIKIPPPPKIPPPEVRRADIDRLQRLINEFRAELSALGVRITAVEEQLAAVKARLAQDTTRITGDWTFVYFVPLSGNPDVGPFPTIDRNRIRLTVRGQVANDFTVTLRARWNANASSIGAAGTPDFDRLIGTWASPWGLNFAVGLQYWALGPQGLLLNLQSSRTGIQVSGTFGGISLTGLTLWNSAASYPSATYAARAEFAPVAGWTFGLNYRTERLGTFNGSGWSLDVQGDLMPGISLLVEYASWSYVSPSGCPFSGTGQGCTALYAQLGLDLGTLAGLSQFSPALNIYYKDYRAQYPVGCPAGTADTFCTNLYSNHQGLWLGGDFQLVTGWGADLTMQLTPKLSGLVAYESGRVNNTFIAGGSPPSGFVSGDNYSGFMVRGTYTLTRNAELNVEYFSLRNTTANTGPFGTSGYAFRVFFRW